MTITVRFAPSPTGRIHIGNTRTALFNWLFAQKHNGRFIQRFDDTDVERSRKEYADSILYDLHWLGIFPDSIEYQSKRFDVYDQAVEKLKAAGVLYPCYETPEELDLRRKIRRTRGLPPVYGREALALTQDEIAQFEADGRRPHWRFLLPNFASDPAETQRTEVHWNDLVRGEETVDLASLSDPVLVREDGTYLYTLPSVVDDIDMGVTHVIRGDDHVTNTGVQIALFRALGAEPPVFGHHNLLTTSSGEGLSKRSGALSVESLREAGVEPMAIASLAVLIGTSENVQAIDSLAELATHFDPASTSKSAAKFDPDELFVLNRALLHRMPFEEVRDRLVLFGISDERAEAFWSAVRDNLDKLPDARDWWRIVNEGPLEAPQFDAETLEFLQAAFALLPEEPWGD
ncbi:glutamate--tRNA ligase, partial [Aquamicrobium sp.]|uniref:glutamate--tRNA ligase n=1 Tax=Aquamicrobium sp. TaxID=1872579 RepID=UPI0025898ECB